jgi:hypothetical protein
MKIVSQLNDELYYVGAVEADESPLENGVYLIPAGAVDVLPPVVEEGFLAKWNGTSFDFEEIAEPTPVVPTPPTAEENKATAKLHLLDTDWVELPSVTDTTEAIYLTNKPDFISYRSAIRAIAINPTAGDLVWPVLPESEWSN